MSQPVGPAALVVVFLSQLGFLALVGRPSAPGPAPPPAAASVASCPALECQGCGYWTLGATLLLGIVIGVGLATLLFTVAGGLACFGAGLITGAGATAASSSSHAVLDQDLDLNGFGTSRVESSPGSEGSLIAADAW